MKKKPEQDNEEDKHIITISNSKIINPRIEDSQTLLEDNQIQLWRCSDFFKNDLGQIIVHYQNSFVLV